MRIEEKLKMIGKMVKQEAILAEVDACITHDNKDQFREIQRCLELLYEGEDQVEWWTSKQPLLGMQYPHDLIMQGRGDELRQRLQNVLDGVYI